MHATVGGVEEGRIRHGADVIRQDYEAAEETWDQHRIQGYVGRAAALDAAGLTDQTEG